MNDTPDRLRAPATGAGTSETAPAVRALLDQALSEGDAAEPSGRPGKGRRRKRRRDRGQAEAMPEAPSAVSGDGEVDDDIVAAPVAAPVEMPAPRPATVPSIYDTWTVIGATSGEGGWESGPAQDGGTSPEPDTPQDSAARTPASPPAGGRGGGHGFDPHLHPGGHHWVYVALAVFLLALGFGAWGVWSTFFAGDADGRGASALSARNDRLTQDISTLRRSDQISRDANRDLERTLAERDEEIAGLRADIAFYERFVGATGQRRGLSVHDLDMRLQSGDVWHFTATLTQNLNRGAVNTGRLTIGIEGTRNDRLEKLAWSGLRKQANAPGLEYSFKYFQQVEGEVMLPQGFKPLRVTVRLVPPGGSAMEQSFPWPETVKPDAGN